MRPAGRSAGRANLRLPLTCRLLTVVPNLIIAVINLTLRVVARLRPVEVRACRLVAWLRGPSTARVHPKRDIIGFRQASAPVGGGLVEPEVQVKPAKFVASRGVLSSRYANDRAWLEIFHLVCV